MDKLQEEDVADLLEKRAAQIRLKSEVDEINAQAQVQKEKRAEQEKIQDLKVSWSSDFGLSYLWILKTYVTKLPNGNEEIRTHELIKWCNDGIRPRRFGIALRTLQAKLWFQVLEYNRLKAEREAAYEAEQEKIRKAKELEIQRLRSLQERAQDHQAERDALRAKRNQVEQFKNTVPYERWTILLLLRLVRSV